MRTPEISMLLKRRVLPCLVCAAVFWFFAKLGQSFRISQGSNDAVRLLQTISGLSAVLRTPLSELSLPDCAAGLTGTASVCVIAYIRRGTAKKYRNGAEHGSARWGGSSDVAPFADKDSENNIILTQTESLTMNPRPKNIKYARNKNMLVIGGSGSGKTRFVLKPNLMQCRSKDYPVSFVVTDPKGELLRDCGKMLSQNGYRIKVLNTVDFGKSHRYNPMAYIHGEKDILKLVSTLMSNTKSEQTGGDPFWEKAETLLFTALIAYLQYFAPRAERNFATLTEMLSAMEVREADETYKNVVDQMFEALEDRDPEHFAARQYRKFKLAAGKTAKSILVSCGARLAPFDIAEIRELTKYDELELDALGDRKTALFIIISDTDDSFNFLAAMCYTQMFNLLCEKADNVYGGRLPVHVRCLIDEAANIGQIPRLEKLMATIRSREISACLVLQAQSQLKALYKDSADTIVGNCDSAIFLGGKEKTTLEDWSRLLGKETIDSVNASENKGNSPSYGRSFQKLGKELMTMDELAVMDGSECILQLRGVRPFLSKKYDVTKHPLYSQLADADRRNAFNIKEHLTTRLGLRAEDEFAVYEFRPLVPPEQRVTDSIISATKK